MFRDKLETKGKMSHVIIIIIISVNTDISQRMLDNKNTRQSEFRKTSFNAKLNFKNQTFILRLRYYAKAYNERRGPSPRLSAWAAQLRRNIAVVASSWRHCV